MDSRELGLVLARQLLGIEDLHYGLWDADLPLSLANFPAAQQRYSDMLLSRLPAPGPQAVRVLDIGCGSGRLLRQMLDRGYHADGVVPAAALAREVRARLDGWSGYAPRIFECKFEDLPLADCRRRYDVALFSESFQYIPLPASLPLLQQILQPGGLLMICDFFKTEHHGDGGPGDRSFGGGHDLRAFYARMAALPFETLEDTDITSRISPNLDLVNDLLMHKVLPASETIGRYLADNRPLLTRLAAWLFRRKLARLRYKYFSGHRNRAVFERYKSYRLMRFRLAEA
jgi:SAM-dependent methyltransferase